MPRKRTDRLVEEAAALLAEYIAAGRTRTDLLKDVAAHIVELRSRFTLDDGRVDWSGRSPEYRAAIAAIYAGAKVPKQHLDTVQTALRYHVGNLLREKASDDELSAVGLTNVSPKDRLQTHRDIINALAATVEDPENIKRADIARYLTHAEALIDAVTTEGIDEMDPARRVAVRVSLLHILRRGEELLAEVRAAEARMLDKGKPHLKWGFGPLPLLPL